MSWAANNPEVYDEIVLQGVAKRYKVDPELAEAWLESYIRDRVLDESVNEICEAEADYFGGLADAAMARMERDQL